MTPPYREAHSVSAPLTRPRPGAHAVLLAAGAGRRFGGGKLIHPFEGRPLVVHAADRALAMPVERVTAVLGCDADALAAALAPLAGPRLRLVRADGWNEGVAASLRAGLAALPPYWRSALVLLGDMPRVPTDAAARLLDALDGGAPAARLLYRGRPAHPVALSRAWWRTVAAPTGDAGLQAVLRATPGLAEIPTEDAGALFDVDTPDALAPRL